MQAARLIFDGESFFLAATFKYEVPTVEPENFLGVHHGASPHIAWTVTDRYGTPMASGRASSGALSLQQRKGSGWRNADPRHSSGACGAASEEEAHRAANLLADIARQFNARVVFEEDALPAGGAGDQLKPWQRHMSKRSQRTSLVRKTSYRVKRLGHGPVQAGEPFAIVAPFTGRSSCPGCGVSQKKKPSRGVFVCSACGDRFWAEEARASIVAAKGAHLLEVIRGKRRGDQLSDNEKFEKWFERVQGQRSTRGLSYDVPGLNCSRITGAKPGCDSTGPKQSHSEQSKGAGSSTDDQKSLATNSFREAPEAARRE